MEHEHEHEHVGGILGRGILADDGRCIMYRPAIRTPQDKPPPNVSLCNGARRLTLLWPIGRWIDG